MYNYNNPEKFRNEYNSLRNYSRKYPSKRLNAFSEYCKSMGEYFLDGDYEHRKRALYYSKLIKSN